MRRRLRCCGSCTYYVSKGTVMQKKKRNFGKFLLGAFICVTVIAIGMTVFIDRYYPLRYFDIIQECAIEYGLAPELIFAVIHAESRFNKDAFSEKGAGGLMQIIDSTAYWLAPRIGMSDFDFTQIFDPEINIRLGCFYLSMLEQQYGDTDVALCAYNAGNGNVDQWLQNSEYSDDGKTLKEIPFRETREYVKRVAGNRKIYSIILNFK